MSLRTFRENPGIQHFPKTEMEWRHFINEVAKWILDSGVVETDIDTLQTDVTQAESDILDAAESSVDITSNPPTFIWNSDTAGVFPAGNPTEDIVVTLYDKDGTQQAQRTLRGTLTTAAGTIAITAVSDSNNAGYSSSYVVVDDATASPRGDITFVLPDLSEKIGTASFIAFDESVAGGTPATGGGK